jgi:hypothetical protein
MIWGHVGPLVIMASNWKRPTYWKNVYFGTIMKPLKLGHCWPRTDQSPNVMAKTTPKMHNLIFDGTLEKVFESISSPLEKPLSL